MHTKPDRSERTGRDRFGLSIAGALALFVFSILSWPSPDGWGDLFRPLIFSDTTPSGGDMGAHVWGPAFMRDYLLPELRLTGWTPDWYAGFPAYTYYMVVPALAIIAVNVGLPWFLGLPIVGALAYAGRRFAHRLGSYRWWGIAALGFIAVLLVGVPYGIAFKVVSVSGLVAFPIAAWGMARMASAPQPVPAFAALAGFVFLFDTNFTIYGGNITSTLAGEFAFSLSLCLCLVALGLSARGMEESRYRAPAAVLVALVALCHIIPVFFMIPALAFLVLADRRASPWWLVSAMAAGGAVPYLVATGWSSGGSGWARLVLALALTVGVVGGPLVGNAGIVRRAGWLLLVGPVAILLAAFWLLPFIAGEPYFNDMGWERLNDVGPALLTVPMQAALPVAAIGALLAFVHRDRVGLMFTGTGIMFASLVANLGESALWNARLLPFYYLSVYMVAAVGVALVLRMAGELVSNTPDRPSIGVIGGGAMAATLALLVAVAMPLRVMPGAYVDADRENAYRWLFFESRADSAVPGWAAWNYSGYEQKQSYREYRDVVATMSDLGAENGCGRAMWEYDKGLDRYGTPMALMLLPFWTSGCIGSMEGLYFESSSSTPFHFLNQSVLSEAPSRAQRDLPYRGFSIDLGVEQLQVTGVRYYMAQSDQAQEAARSHPDLTEVAVAEPFVVFEVAGSELVSGLVYEPVVTAGRTAEEVAGSAGEVEDISRFEIGWESQAVEFYNDPSGHTAYPAEDGPADWARVPTLASTDPQPLSPVQVSDIDPDTNSLSFAVDKVGVPVLVKMSYYPNWQVSGADGPWRVGPNLMVVVPTDNEVTFSYGRSMVEVLSMLVTLLGLAGVVLLGRLDRKPAMVRQRQIGRSVDAEPVGGASEVVDSADAGPEAELVVASNEAEPVEADLAAAEPEEAEPAETGLDEAALAAAETETAAAETDEAGLDDAGLDAADHSGAEIDGDESEPPPPGEPEQREPTPVAPTEA